MRLNSFEDYIDERIRFIKSVISNNNTDPKFHLALNDFQWIKSKLDKEKSGEEISWDDIVSVVSPYMIKTYNLCIQNSNYDLLPLNMRLDAKNIANDLSKIYSDIISKCNKPFVSSLIFSI